MNLEELKKALLELIKAGDGKHVHVTPQQLEVDSQELREAFRALEAEGLITGHNLGPYDVDGAITALGKGDSI